MLRSSRKEALAASGEVAKQILIVHSKEGQNQKLKLEIRLIPFWKR